MGLIACVWVIQWVLSSQEDWVLLDASVLLPICGFILLGAALDGVDGWVARWLDARSSFGMYLDAVADFFTFCLAPGLSVFLILMLGAQPADGGGMASAWVWTGGLAGALYVATGAGRLIRYVNDVRQMVRATQTKDQGAMFQGLPTTAAGTLMILICTVVANYWPELSQPGRFWVAGALIFTTMALGVLMVSTMPVPHLRRVVHAIRRSHGA